MVLQSKITKQHARLARNAWSLEGISSITKAKHLKWKEKKKKNLKVGGWDVKQTCLFLSFYCIFVMAAGSVSIWTLRKLIKCVCAFTPWKSEKQTEQIDKGWHCVWV